jgi:hypothetical protein
VASITCTSLACRACASAAYNKSDIVSYVRVSGTGPTTARSTKQRRFAGVVCWTDNSTPHKAMHVCRCSCWTDHGALIMQADSRSVTDGGLPSMTVRLHEGRTSMSYKIQHFLQVCAVCTTTGGQQQQIGQPASLHCTE